MKTMQFFKDFLKDEARITIADTKGNIFYTGDLGSLPVKIVRGTQVAAVEGLGSENDLIITVI